MIKYPKYLEDLIESFKCLPGVGRKTAERYAFSVLNDLSNIDVEEFINNLDNVKNNIHHCKNCGNLTTNDICDICQDEKRNHRQIMVVEQPKDVFIIENLNEYKGIYNVLNGSIKFAKGISIDDLNIEPLLEKAKANLIDEVILACNATLEGETTAKYIKELLSDYKNIKISRLAYGMPVGGDIEYVDELTLLRALEGRNKY